MAVQLNISLDNKIQTLTSGVIGDILDNYLAETNASTTRHIKLDMIRNCCASGKITLYFPPRYVFTLTNVSDLPYSPIPVVPTVNDRQVEFRINGIDVSYIKKFEVETNADLPNTGTFAWKEYTAAIATTTGYSIFYLENAANSVHQIRITTIDDYVYLLDVTYDWANTMFAITTTSITIASHPTLPTQPTIDFGANTIEFDTEDWGLDVDDEVFLDGVYQYNLTQVETGANVVETISKFFNIKLRCLVTSYLASNPTKIDIGLMFNALELADGCNLSVAQKCSLYERVIRQLILANQIKAASPLGCNCGCS